jgi:AsmA protein
VAHGNLGAVPLSVQGSVGPLPALLPGALRPASVALSGTAGAATLALKGSIASPRALTGKDLAFMANIPDLAAFSPRLPALKGVALHTWIGDAPGGIALHDLVLTAPEGDLEGDATVGRAGVRPVVQATLTSRRLDLDALRRAMPRPPVRPPAPAPAASPAAAPAPAPAAKPVPPPPMISARPFDLAPLRAADADLRLTVAALRLGGADLRDVSGHLLDVGGNLAVAPFAAVLPGGPVDGTFTLDASVPDASVPDASAPIANAPNAGAPNAGAPNAGASGPPMAFTLHAPALALGPSLQGFGFAPAITGPARLDLDLHGTGASPQAIAASLRGDVGLSMVDGDISNQLLQAALGAALHDTKLPASLGAGRTRLRCVALRLRADGGRASVRTFAIDTSRVSITGGGSVDLGAETFDLHLQPRVLLGSVDAGAPVAITGPWRAPKIAEQRGANGRVALVIGNGRGADVCGPALSVARGGQAGPVPPPRPQEHGIQPGDILRLLRHHG